MHTAFRFVRSSIVSRHGGVEKNYMMYYKKTRFRGVWAAIGYKLNEFYSFMAIYKYIYIIK